MKLPFFSRQEPASPEAKDSAAAATMVMNPGQPRWTPLDYHKLAQEAYVCNIIAYQAINRIGEAVGSVKWTAWRGEQEVTETPLLDLIRQPNPEQSYSEYVMAKVGYEMLSGNGYEERVVVGGEPRELYTLRPDRMTITVDVTGRVSRFTYTVGGKKTNWDRNPDGTIDVLHTKLFNPIDDVYGQAPVWSGRYAIDQHNEGMAWVKSLLQNSARPSGALVTEGELSDDNFNRLKTQMEDQYQGARNAGRPMLLEGGLSWQPMGLAPKDMEIIEGNREAARNVALTFGVPPQLLGIPGDNTYSNYQEARLAFWEDTVIPMVDRIAGQWSRWLGPSFGDLELRADMDHIPAIADKRSTMFEMAQASDFLTINEKREMAGFKPISGGNVLMQPINQMPFGADPDPEADLKRLANIAGYEQK